MKTATAYTVLLEHAPNGDIAHDERRGYWSPPIDPKRMTLQAPDVPTARRLFREWIKRNGLGIGNMTRATGTLRRGKKAIGRFEYGGTLWSLDGKTQITAPAAEPAIPAAADEVDADLHVEEGDEDQEREWPPSASVLASDRRLARRGLSVFRFSSGAVMTQNSRGRCIDAPCCGCCS